MSSQQSEHKNLFLIRGNGNYTLSNNNHIDSEIDTNSISEFLLAFGP